MRVLIVDDSTVYRSQIRAALTGAEGIEVVGFASNGRFALDFLKTRAADLMTLDLEMPEMNGLEVLAEIKRLGHKIKVIVFSSMSKAGAESALQALQAGAHDVIVKPTLGAGDKDPAELIRRHLLPKLLQFQGGAGSAGPSSPKAAWGPGPAAPNATMNLPKALPQVLVIASSTGGPAALEQLFAMIAPPFRCPILIAQHMPPVFTATLAERLTRICGATVREAKHHEPLKAGEVLIAPGDFHLRVGVGPSGPQTDLDGKGERRNSVRPAADYLFETAATIFKNGCLGLVLTGMGADGKDGAVAIKERGGGILIQNKESCVVFGMPGAVFDAKAFDGMADLAGLAAALIELGLVQKPKEVSRAG